MRRLLKIVLLLLVVLAAGAAALFFSVFGGKASIPDGMRIGAVTVVKDGYVSAYLLDVGQGEIALVDSGNDGDARAILATLARRSLDPLAVKAILLTHGDADHTNGAHVFKNATVMALAPDIDLAEGKAVRMPFSSPHSTGIKVGQTLKDGDSFNLGNLRVEVFAVPGHTAGSAALLIDGVLFLGDSAEITSDGWLEPATWFFCADKWQNRTSLRQLAVRLAGRAESVKAIACSHSGVSTAGFEPLRQLATRLASEK
jgi:hydroxyacylglutathione hydrolase